MKRKCHLMIYDFNCPNHFSALTYHKNLSESKTAGRNNSQQNAYKLNLQMRVESMTQTYLWLETKQILKIFAMPSLFPSYMQMIIGKYCCTILGTRVKPARCGQVGQTLQKESKFVGTLDLARTKFR